MYADRDLTTSQWEQGQGSRGSRIYRMLAPYQREAYHQLEGIAAKYHGAFLCAGVGLGKTVVGLMLIEWLVEFERKRVALIVPKSSREWSGRRTSNVTSRTALAVAVRACRGPSTPMFD